MLYNVNVIWLIRKGKVKMALIRCPECGKEISNTVKRCPHCGFKLSKKNLATYETLKPAEHNDFGYAPTSANIPQDPAYADNQANALRYEFNPPSASQQKTIKKSKKKLIIALISIVIALAIIAAVLIVFLAPRPADQEFLNALAAGLDKRWSFDKDTSEMTPQEISEYYKELANYELDVLNGYDVREFSDPQLKQYAKSYIGYLNQSIISAEQIAQNEDYTNWYICQDNRSLIIYYIYEGYGLNVENKEILNSMIANAKDIIAAQNSSSDPQTQDGNPQAEAPEDSGKDPILQEMVNSMKFERVNSKDVVGIIENTTGYDLRTVYFDFKFYDKDGVVVSTDTNIESDWPAGEKRKIEFKCFEHFVDFDFTVSFN